MTALVFLTEGEAINMTIQTEHKTTEEMFKKNLIQKASPPLPHIKKKKKKKGNKNNNKKNTQIHKPTYTFKTMTSVKDLAQKASHTMPYLTNSGEGLNHTSNNLPGQSMQQNFLIAS